MDDAARLVAHIRALPGFKLVSDIGSPYGHMGATLSDAVLQAGVKYETVVRPRVQRLMREHPAADTTSRFASLIEQRGGEHLLSWHGRKIITLEALVKLLQQETVETEAELAAWLARPGSLDRLRQIKGIKDKTANYLHILVGNQSVAVDRHLFRFLAEAGAPTTDYAVAHAAIKAAAAQLGVPAAVLDHSIWRYMSERPAAEARVAADAGRDGAAP